MDRQWILTLQISLCAAFVLFSANEIIFLNLRLFNLLSITILFVVLLQLSRLKLCDHGLTAARAYMLLALVFLAGINIKSRPRAFFFLALLFLVIAVHRGGFTSYGIRILVQKDALAPIMSFALALVLFLLPVFGAAPLWLAFALTLLLLAVQLFELWHSSRTQSARPEGGRT